MNTENFIKVWGVDSIFLDKVLIDRSDIFHTRLNFAASEARNPQVRRNLEKDDVYLFYFETR